MLCFNYFTLFSLLSSTNCRLLELFLQSYFILELQSYFLGFTRNRKLRRSIEECNLSNNLMENTSCTTVLMDSNYESVNMLSDGNILVMLSLYIDKMSDLDVFNSTLCWSSFLNTIVTCQYEQLIESDYEHILLLLKSL